MDAVLQCDTLEEQIARTLVGGLSPGVLPEGEHEAKLAEFRRMAREEANPFPLIGMQWPELLVDDPDDAQYFEGQICNELDPRLRLDQWQRLNIVAFFDPTVK